MAPPSVSTFSKPNFSALWRAFGGDSRVRRDALAYLLDSGYLVRVEPEGRKGAWYAAAAENEEQL